MIPPAIERSLHGSRVAVACAKAFAESLSGLRLILLRGRARPLGWKLRIQQRMNFVGPLGLWLLSLRSAIVPVERFSKDSVSAESVIRVRAK